MIPVQHYYRDKNNLVAHCVGGRSIDMKTHLLIVSNDVLQKYCKMIIVSIILMVLIKNSENRSEMNDCGNITNR